jgi:hypothetical protein
MPVTFHSRRHFPGQVEGWPGLLESVSDSAAIVLRGIERFERLR